jgi:hypothetical protein
LRTGVRSYDSLTPIHDADQLLLVPSFVAGQSYYMIGKVGGAKAEAAFLRLLESGWFRLIDRTESDFSRIASLKNRGSRRAVSRPSFGRRRASVVAVAVAVAERMRVTEAMTIDVRDFAVVRPIHAPAFALLPG